MSAAGAADETRPRQLSAESVRHWTSAPIPLPPNQPARRPYRGGEGIARFRRMPWTGTDPFIPEDFLASTTTVHGSESVGLTLLDDSITLRDAVRADPQGFLGPEHVARFGAETMLLVIVLDTGERLFVHVHPDDAFAAARFGEPRGKTEAWIVTAVADGTEGFAAIGFQRDVSSDELAEWFGAQDAEAMLAAMHRVTLRPGDTLLVPAGIPHAIGPGVTLVELQQPQDLSILLEYAGFGSLTEADALLGLPLDEAIGAFDLRGWSRDEVDGLRADAGIRDDGITALFPTQAAPYFRAERIAAADGVELDAGFSVLVVLDGSGQLRWRGGERAVQAGDTLLVPYGAGAVTLSGGITVVRALPPA